MALLPRVKLDEYYEQYRTLAITFTKEVISVTGLLTKMVNLKCGVDFFPCVIYSTSFEEAKIIANIKTGIFKKLEESNNALQLRFCFRVPETGEQIAFLVASRVTGTEPYNGSQDISLFTLQYSHRPPDDLIEIMGRIVEANYNYSKRKTETFQVTHDLMRRMKLSSGNVNLKVNGNTANCVIKELLFGGVRLAVPSSFAKTVVDQNAEVVFEFVEPKENCDIQGKIKRIDIVAGMAELAVITLDYFEPVPMAYKYRLSNYVSTLRIEVKKPAPVADPVPVDSGNNEKPDAEKAEKPDAEKNEKPGEPGVKKADNEKAANNAEKSTMPKEKPSAKTLREGNKK